MNTPLRVSSTDPIETVEIRVRGRVQGVGFRPTVWRIAREFGLDGDVLNDREGVLIRLRGAAFAVSALTEELRTSPPPLAGITRSRCATTAGISSLASLSSPA